MTRIRIVPIILITIVALAVLFGGYEFYQQNGVVTPLQTALSKIDGVKSTNITPGNPNVVNISLGNVPDLQTTYKDIEQTAETSLRGSVTVHISGNAGAQLNRQYEDIMPVLMEGLAKGNYTQMIADVSKQMQKNGIEARITMDSENLFVQMTKGRNHLYSILPLSTHDTSTAN